MTKLRVRPDRPVDALTVAVLRAVDVVAGELQITYFMVGAMARDILLTHVCGIETGVGTRDVDLAVAAQLGPQFEGLKERLIATGKFQPAQQPHRMLYQARQGTPGWPLDIIPFRGTERTGNMLAWPPGKAERMNVVGYEETLAATVQVQIETDLSVRVASLPGLAMLKIFAWDDRGNANPKDARDFVTLLRNYADTEEERLYGEEFKILEAVENDHARAGARLLGCDVRRIALPATLQQMLRLLDDPRQAERLVTHMTAALHGIDDSADMADQLLHEFRIGLAGA